MKVAVYTSQESFRRRQYESYSVYILSNLEASCLKVAVYISPESFKRSSLKKLRCIYLKNHLEGSNLKAAGHISQESPTRKQCESCGVYISRVIYKEAF